MGGVSPYRPPAAWRPGDAMRACFIGLLLAAATCAGAGAATTPGRQASSADAGPSTKALALRWYRALQAGRIDRSRLTRDYSDYLSEGAIAAMSRYLRSYGDAGSADVLRTRVIGDQTFYYYKLYLARGDAITMLIGFNADGKITGITFPSMGRE